MSSSITVKFNINLEEEKRLEINVRQFKLLNEFWKVLCINIKQNISEDDAFENAEKISNVLMNKLLFSFKNKDISENFIENAKYGNDGSALVGQINFKTPEEFSKFVIFFEKLNKEQQESFLNFLKKIYEKNLYLTSGKNNELFLSAKYIQMIINIFSEKYKNIDSFYRELVRKNGFTNNLEIDEEIKLNKIIDYKAFEKFFEFFLKDYNEEELEEISKKNFEEFLNSDDFKNKKDIEKQPSLSDIQDNKEREKAKKKKQEIISCMKEKAKIIKAFFEKEFDEKQNILENKPLKTLIIGSAFLAFDALLIGVLVKRDFPNLFENRMINLGLIICSSMLLIAAEALIVKKVYNLEIKNIDNLKPKAQTP